jgi:hypothetical protein
MRVTTLGEAGTEPRVAELNPKALLVTMARSRAFPLARALPTVLARNRPVARV